MAENLATLNIQLPQEDLERIDNIETELKFIVRDLDVPIPILD